MKTYFKKLNLKFNSIHILSVDNSLVSVIKRRPRYVLEQIVIDKGAICLWFLYVDNGS